MGSCCSSNERVEPVSEADTQLNPVNKGGYRDSDSQFQGPVTKRGCTDFFFLLLMLVFVGALGYLIFYCFMYGDIYRVLNGYDTCGNICGRRNNHIFEGLCKGEDMTSKKFLKITNYETKEVWQGNIKKNCVDTCDKDEKLLANRCIPKPSTTNVNPTTTKTVIGDFIERTSEDLEACHMEILYLCLIAFGFSIFILILFRFLVGIVVWLVLIGTMIASLIGAVYLWVVWKRKKEELQIKTIDMEIENRSVTSYLVYAIVATVAAVIIWLVIFVMRKRIKLVIQLFKEAGKAINSMPFILFQPCFTFIALGAVISTWLYFTLWIESAGFLTLAKDTDTVKYKDYRLMIFKKDTTIKVARWYNLFALFWFAQFCIGCQHMVIAGAISKWFFTRNKDSLGVPILRGYWNLVRYHLGSVALGSLLIAMVQMVRAVLKFIESQLKGRDNACITCMFRACQCCLWCFEKILQFLTRNAYIEIAMYGHNFCKAGQQAFKLLASNALRVAAINSVGDFVLFLGKALVVIATVLIGTAMLDSKEGLHNKWVPLALVGLFAYLVSHCFLTVYEMAIDTIFLCFCEDCEQNDGISRPYYMSRGLMEFVQNSKKAMAIQDSSNAPSQAWSTTSPQGIK